jgi:hypothetical protein
MSSCIMSGSPPSGSAPSEPAPSEPVPSESAVSTGTALDHVLAFLIPFFLQGVGGDHAAARSACVRLLYSYGAETDQQCMLAAEIIAFSFTTLDNLGQSFADPDMAISTRLRLRSNANALSRAAERNRQALERAKKSAAEPAAIAERRDAEPSAMQKIRDAIVQAAPVLAETLTNAGPISRQQRRLLTRKIEQARAARDREARKAARLAPRAAAMAALPSA